MLILNCLVGGNSIRVTSGLTGAARNTISKLIKDVGLVCTEFQNKTLRELTCKRVQADEIWPYIGGRNKNLPPERHILEGTFWTWISMDADSRLVFHWHVGKRDSSVAHHFMSGMAERLKGRIQLTTDGFRSYVDAVECAFGSDIDYAMRSKSGDETSIPNKGRKGIFIERISGNPDPNHISTNYVERFNGTLRNSLRRYHRKTYGNSKKLEYHNCTLSLFMMYYNFINIHTTLKVTPAMAAGITDVLIDWTDVLRLTFPDRA